ncbi:MAG TPA: cytidylate kinase family protein [Halanaerobiales bacterium]|nr:cytidylate kinase family protein [Halanaerobiales bacterium]
MFVITISRQTASLGDEIAAELADKLGVKLITRNYVIDNWLSEIADEHDLHMLRETSKYYLRTAQNGQTFKEYIIERLKKEAEEQSLVILGLGSQVIFKDYAHAVHIKVICSDGRRVKRIMEKYNIQQEQAVRTLDLSDRKHRRYVHRLFNKDWENISLYHMSINTDGLDIKEASNLIIHLLEMKKEEPQPLFRPQEEITVKRMNTKDIDFVHESERDFAEILDMYNIEWEYEPSEFPLEWDAEGNIVLGFRPDFYLPEFDTYIELTTMKQKYVTEKNKKVKLLQELYPDVNVNIVYKKDYHKLLKRFGVNNIREDEDGKDE